jgi:uncharacterized glyoxalase superfamily protein PhnB
LRVEDSHRSHRKEAADHGGAGATSVFEPEETEWETKRARVLDPEGYEWSFGTYQPGQS